MTSEELASNFTKSLAYAEKTNEAKQDAYDSMIGKKLQIVLSIVTIYNEANAAQWMGNFLKYLPKLGVNSDVAIEVILCKTIKDDNAPENGTRQVSQKTIGAVIHKECEYIYKGEFRFDDARNAAKYHADGDWIMQLDTDEILIPAQIPDIIEAVTKAPNSSGGIKCSVFSHINTDMGYHREACAAVRLFRNDPNIQYQGRIHEIVDFSIKENGYLINDSTFMVYHQGYECEQTDLIGKLRRNLKGLCAEYCEPSNPNAMEHIEGYLLNTAAEIRRMMAAK